MKLYPKEFEAAQLSSHAIICYSAFFFLESIYFFPAIPAPAASTTHETGSNGIPPGGGACASTGRANANPKAIVDANFLISSGF
jgi:hypothetical protein